MQTKLVDATRGYNRSLRWGDLGNASDYLPATSRAGFLAKYEDTEELVIVEYEVVRLELDKKTGIAASRAEIRWHTDRSTIVKTTSVDQAWQWYEGDFVLVDERRSGGDPLGVFVEPAEERHPYLPGLEAFRQTHEIGEENKKGKRPGRRTKRNASEPSERPDDSDPDALARTAP